MVHAPCRIREIEGEDQPGIHGYFLVSRMIHPVCAANNFYDRILMIGCPVIMLLVAMSLMVILKSMTGVTRD